MSNKTSISFSIETPVWIKGVGLCLLGGATIQRPDGLWYHARVARPVPGYAKKTRNFIVRKVLLTTSSCPSNLEWARRKDYTEFYDWVGLGEQGVIHCKKLWRRFVN